MMRTITYNKLFDDLNSYLMISDITKQFINLLWNNHRKRIYMYIYIHIYRRLYIYTSVKLDQHCFRYRLVASQPPIKPLSGPCWSIVVTRKFHTRILFWKYHVVCEMATICLGIHVFTVPNSSLPHKKHDAHGYSLASINKNVCWCSR